ncbi:MAG TPA: BON domain-containing protein [Vicinamibacterales bacterium]|nr:BON domain-containing protein [Vicinamibacterales bacterium]
MSTANLTDQDLRLRDIVLRQLEWDPAVDASGIEVTAREGAVHLRGTATSWQQRDAAERAAYDAPGITMVDNQIIVDPPNEDNCEI